MSPRTFQPACYESFQALGPFQCVIHKRRVMFSLPRVPQGPILGPLSSVVFIIDFVKPQDTLMK